MSVLKSRAVARNGPDDAQGELNRSPAWMTGLFTAAVLLSAALLFAVQPLFARMVLPYLGGTPATWSTCLVFFQMSLLGGYAYVHLLSTRLGPPRQLVVHGSLLVVALATLPVQLPSSTAPATSQPVAWLLLSLASAVGLPFFALSATAPLLQRWFARRTGTDPYFLYAASNAGSLIGLLSYPFVVEATMTLDQQRFLWSLTMVGTSVLIVTAGLFALRGYNLGATLVSAPAQLVEAPVTGSSWRERLRWLALSAVPSSLLLGVTLHISTDVAAVPLLWVVPLAIYLLTFIAAFASRPLLSRVWMHRLLPLAVFSAVAALVFNPSWIWSLTIHLVAFAIVAFVCHRELAERRPAADHLTSFYLWLSVGGALGGFFSALVAPLVFTQVLEYPLALVAAALLRPSPAWQRRRTESQLALVALPAFMFTITMISWMFGFLPGFGAATLVSSFWLCAAMLLAFSNRAVPFALAIAAVLVSHLFLPRQQGARVLFQARSFFGVHRVMLDASAMTHQLYHGTTLHGWQATEAVTRCDLTSYYHREGPIGQVFAALGDRVHRVAVIGLGAGALACYGRDDTAFTFYELDPVVERVARDPALFTYLANARGTVRVIQGDGRISLSHAAPHSYDLLIIDAFSSDAIPTHLLTREFLTLALSRVQLEGLVAFHISNRHLDLGPVLAATASSLEVAAFDQYHSPSVTDANPSRWLVIGRETGFLPLVTAGERWRLTTPGSRVWTDDFTNLLDVLTWSPSAAAGVP